MQLSTRFLEEFIGAKVQNSVGQPLGKIVDLMYDSAKEIQRLILCNSHLFGEGKRYFAIPASSKLIHITEEGKITINASLEDLQFAKGFVAPNYPKPNFKLGPSIFELFNYESSDNQQNS